MANQFKINRVPNGTTWDKDGDLRVRKARKEAEAAGQSFNVYHRHNVNSRGGNETDIVEFEIDGKLAGGFVSSGSFITRGPEVFEPG